MGLLDSRTIIVEVQLVEEKEEAPQLVNLSQRREQDHFREKFEGVGTSSSIEVVVNHLLLEDWHFLVDTVDDSNRGSI